ncbi:MAG TPA: O-acetyl-ADP-ribose deacetylase [Bacteroidales bacterium]|nr:O-acetyl-ADP-ribose deacetylase [Bacteroidales bacterium]
MNKRIHLYKGDITTLAVDAIVNAANKTLLGGGGVDGAIHAAAGPELIEECRDLMGCETGKARLTNGYRLKAKHIIHTVGPVWYGGHRDETEKLASCYQSSLEIARDNKLKTIAFPGISTGVYGFPQELAAFIAVNETRRFLLKNKYPVNVTFVTFTDEHYETYRKLLEQ